MARICPLLSCGKAETKECTNECRFFYKLQNDYETEGVCRLLELVEAAKSIAMDLEQNQEKS